jgi:hypothetical protein
MYKYVQFTISLKVPFMDVIKGYIIFKQMTFSLNNQRQELILHDSKHNNDFDFNRL